MLPGATLVAGDPRLVWLIAILLGRAADTPDDFDLRLFGFRGRLLPLLAAALRRLGCLVELLKRLVLALRGPDRSSRLGIWWRR